MTEQGHPKGWKHITKASTGNTLKYQAIGRVSQPIIEWLRAYFPADKPHKERIGMKEYGALSALPRAPSTPKTRRNSCLEERERSPRVDL